MSALGGPVGQAIGRAHARPYDVSVPPLRLLIIAHEQGMIEKPNRMRHIVLFFQKQVLFAMRQHRWLQFHGILITLLLIALFTEVPNFHVPTFDEIPLLLASIAYAAFMGGFVAGFLAAFVSLGFDAGVLSLPHRLFHYDLAREDYLLLLALVSLFLAFVVGKLRVRVQRSGAEVEEHVGRRTAQLQAMAQSERLARTQVDALFEAIADSVYVFDREGRVLRMNRRARECFQQYQSATTASFSAGDRWQQDRSYDEQGQFLLGDASLLRRVLRGEVLTPANTSDVRYPVADGPERWFSISGAPTYDSAGSISGAIMVVRDVTEQHQMRQRTQDSLEALLLLAEEMVTLPVSLNVQEEGKDNVEECMECIAQRLAGLISNVLSCQRVAIRLLDPETRAPRSLSLIGIPLELKRRWKERLPGYSLYEIFNKAGLIERLAANEVFVVDFTQPPLRDYPNPFNLREILSAPMMVGTTLVGLLVLDYGPQPHTYTPQELALARAVGKLAALIVERERLLAKWTQAQASALALQEANQQMDEFIGIASHELRTPLTSIKVSVQLAQRQLQRGEQRKDEMPDNVRTMLDTLRSLLNRTERQIDMQNRLVSDLLDVSRIHAHRLELHPELCNLTELVKETVAEQRDLIPQRTILLDALPADELLVLADADRLRQVINNYLSNALKYSSMDKPVRVSLVRHGNEVCVQVVDKGPGLTETQQQRVWERFYRVPGVEVCSGSGVGLGLGLHICKMIIERQGGQVGVQSTPGLGSTFWFTLPLAETY
jgi:signal transduction histidine kinase/PAS domain-containing protein